MFQELEKDLTERNTQLTELVKRCSALQNVAEEMDPLAAQLYEHLCILQRNFADTEAQLHARLIHLQV